MSEEPRDTFAPFQRKLQAEQSHELSIASFRRNYQMLVQGDTGRISRTEIDPVESVPALDEIDQQASQANLLSKVVMIKLNGGLGTSMGLDRPKSVIPVRDDLSFLDIIARQVIAANKQYAIDIPLVFMNSFNTHEDTERSLEPYTELRSDIPFDFLQNKVPKVMADSLEPARWEANPELEWCPPGHGDIYISLVTSGMLEMLLDRGYEYAFVSNADNLGATLEPAIVDYMHRTGTDFLMEVARRTPADRKGGHLAKRKDGGLGLRERAQCPPEEEQEFQDIGLYKYFNTNTLWIHLPSLRELMKRHGNVLPLPLIRNEKTVDPRDPESPKVYQLETAMGSAISLFDNAQALLVPRTRFAPVKTTDDLLVVRSDAYTLTDDYRVVPSQDCTVENVTVELDKEHYKLLDQLKAAFPSGPPSLKDCEMLTIIGPYTFGSGVVCKGVVELHNDGHEKAAIPDNSVLGNG
ncbi:MAG: UTP--glucose-1-phosphate uridylyltransferase [Ectothiorhodospiraceae bacterium]|nr:UTP--glucose-1-phosphate uridylyltransferase [Ectothiorhodospiraceae bacterium]